MTTYWDKLAKTNDKKWLDDAERILKVKRQVYW